MTAMNPSTESLLHGESDEEKSCYEESLTRAQRNIIEGRSRSRYSFFRVSSFVSLILNVILITVLLLQWLYANDIKPSEYAGLVRNMPIEWNPYSGYGVGNKNETDRSIMWESLDMSPGEVALDNEWAKNHGLPAAQPFPWDKSRSIYLLNGHHSLHCLFLQRKIRRWVTIAYHNGTQLDGYAHLVHCMGHLLQNILCEADDTPMYTTRTLNKDTGLHQTRMCRSWDTLNQWAESQTSCFVFINETQGVDTTFSRYRYCPKDSPYADQMRSRLGLPKGWYEERPAEIDSIPPYWQNFTNNVFTFQEAEEI